MVDGCKNINECELNGNDLCPENSHCVDNDGSFGCNCNPGYFN